MSSIDCVRKLLLAWVCLQEDDVEDETWWDKVDKIPDEIVPVVKALIEHLVKLKSKEVDTEDAEHYLDEFQAFRNIFSFFHKFMIIEHRINDVEYQEHDVRAHLELQNEVSATPPFKQDDTFDALTVEEL